MIYVIKSFMYNHNLDYDYAELDIWADAYLGRELSQPGY